jgi:transcription antitermination factor NusG
MTVILQRRDHVERATSQENMFDTHSTDQMNGPRWYVLSVKHQHERRAERALGWKGFEALAPTYRARRTWSVRSKNLDLPLFSGYVFCRFDFAERIPVLDTPGIARIVGFGNGPAPVADEEIAAIKMVVASRLPVRPWPHLKPGDRVRIEDGPLRGVEGTLLKEKDSLRLVLGVELLQRSIAVELEPESIVPLRARYTSA